MRIKLKISLTDKRILNQFILEISNKKKISFNYLFLWNYNPSIWKKV